MIFNGWVFQSNALCDDPENENFRKIFGWVFHDLPIRVKSVTFGHNFIGTILTWAFLRSVIKKSHFCLIWHICQRFFIIHFHFRDFWEKKLRFRNTFGYLRMILWEFILIILMMAVFHFERNLDRLVKKALSKVSHPVLIALKKYFR